MSGLLNMPKHDNLIYDVGMHKGEDTEFYLRKGFSVIAIEANPELVSLCRNRLKKWIDDGQLVIIEGAVMDIDTAEECQKRVVFYKNDKKSVWGTIRSDWAERNALLGCPSRMMEVNVVNFTDVMQRFGVPYFLKIDIEGADIACLNALKNFQERPNYLSFESDHTAFANIRREGNVLNSLGYESFHVVEQSSIAATQTPPQPAREGQYIDHSFRKGSSGLFGAELAIGWKSQQQILRQYRAICFGHYFLGRNGVFDRWGFKTEGRLRSLARWGYTFLTKVTVPGWYDLHARHKSVYK